MAMDSFETSADGLRFLCPECKSIHFIENKANLDQEQTQQQAGLDDISYPSSPPETEREEGEQRICPKCGHAQTGGASCHKCGLDFLRFDPSNLPPDPKLGSRIWAQIEHNPQDQQLHENFLKACNEVGRLDYATRQYRVLSRLPGMAKVSQRMQARILSLAQAQLMPGGLEATSRDDPKKTSRILVWVLFILALGGIGYLIYASSELLEKMY